MKKIIILAAILCLAVIRADAQSWVEGLGRRAADRAEQRAKQKVEDKVDQKVDEAVDAAFDAAEDAVTGEGDEGGQSAEQSGGKKKQTGQSDGDAADSQAPESQPAAQTPREIESVYAKNDFVPGDEIIFDDQMSGEKMGEFPSQWDLLGGNAEVANIDGRQCIYLDASTTVAPLMKNMKNYLPDVYTIELDFWQNDWHVTYNTPSQNYIMYLYDENGTEIVGIEFGEGYVEWWYTTPSNDRRNGRLDNIPGNLNAWNHFSLSFNQRALKVYINGVRMINLPSVAGADHFSIYKNGYSDHKAAITNVRIAQGAVPLYDRMMTDGKIVTYGITFDVGKSTVKPESMTEINRIAQLMKDNPSLKFSVEGHTDSTGNPASNQTLSDARSKAVMEKLIGLGIAADRLKAAGKGQNNPVADNSTDEGRAKNRRVEFVKQ